MVLVTSVHAIKKILFYIGHNINNFKNGPSHNKVTNSTLQKLHPFPAPRTLIQKKRGKESNWVTINVVDTEIDVSFQIKASYRDDWTSNTAFVVSGYGLFPNCTAL